MGAKVDAIMKEVGDILKKIFSKLTPNQGKIGSLVLSAIIAILFFATAIGRTLIVIFGYVCFIIVIMAFANKMYKFASQYSTAEPKPKSVASEEEPVVTSENADDKITEEELKEGHQISIDEIESHP